MPQTVKTISFKGANCYLVSAGGGYVLIDTGYSRSRSDIEKELGQAGCQPGNIKLVILTHGDYDHAGNAAYLRKKYNCPIALHRGESEVVENANMLLSRRRISLLKRIAARIVLPFLMLGRFERFKPDLYFKDKRGLSEYGFDAQVIHIPGHSRGSLGILTAGGDLFCGDLFVGGDRPALNSLIDDTAAAKSSVEKLNRFKINTVYPGHGRPFSMEQFNKNNR